MSATRSSNTRYASPTTTPPYCGVPAGKRRIASFMLIQAAWPWLSVTPVSTARRPPVTGLRSFWLPAVPPPRKATTVKAMHVTRASHGQSHDRPACQTRKVPRAAATTAKRAATTTDAALR